MVVPVPVFGCDKLALRLTLRLAHLADWRSDIRVWCATDGTDPLAANRARLCRGATLSWYEIAVEFADGCDAGTWELGR